MNLSAAIAQFCHEQGADKTYWIAYSGGLDSQVLLALFAEYRSQYPIKLRAIHIHHGLSPHADAWLRHCQDYCADQQIDFTYEHAHIALSPGDSLEEAARDTRYACLLQRLQAGDLLLTAHHQEDQAETVLLQLMRGAGPKGLAAMPEMKTFGRGILARPLLAFSRADLESYAIEKNLTWVRDESNDDHRHRRNFLRHKVLPLLKICWPAASTMLARAARHSADAQTVLDEVAAEDSAKVQGTRMETLSVKKILQFSIPRQRLILRHWLKARGCTMPDTAKIEVILTQVLHARWDKTPLVTWEQKMLRRYRDDLYVLPMPSACDVAQFVWRLPQTLSMPGIGDLHAHPIQGDGLSMDIRELTVRFRQGGEVCQLPGRKEHHTLKNLLQQWEVLPWERDRLPLLYAREKLIAIPGFFMDENVKTKCGEMGYFLSFKKTPAV